MSEPFKNLLNKELIEGMAGHFKRNWKKFNLQGFVADAARDLDSLELKQRTQRITDVMINHLPDDFEKAGKIILASLGAPLGDDLSIDPVNNEGIAGWAIMPLADYVGLRGHDHFDLSMTLFKELTMRSSSEFGIRFFLLNSPKKTMTVMKKWTKDSNHHVRRLASEGCRPRLHSCPCSSKTPCP